MTWVGWMKFSIRTLERPGESRQATLPYFVGRGEGGKGAGVLCSHFGVLAVGAGRASLWQIPTLAAS